MPRALSYRYAQGRGEQYPPGPTSSSHSSPSRTSDLPRDVDTRCAQKKATFGESLVSATFKQGLALVHISTQPEPNLVIEATSSVHFQAQPEPFCDLNTQPSPHTA
jgi:hypothetical protein